MARKSRRWSRIALPISRPPPRAATASGRFCPPSASAFRPGPGRRTDRVPGRSAASRRWLAVDFSCLASGTGVGCRRSGCVSCSTSAGPPAWRCLVLGSVGRRRAELASQVRRILGLARHVRAEGRLRRGLLGRLGADEVERGPRRSAGRGSRGSSSGARSCSVRRRRGRGTPGRWRRRSGSRRRHRRGRRPSPGRPCAARGSLS